MREAQSKEAKRSRYEEDPGEDTFYDGAAARKTIAETTRTTLQTYHSALNSKSLQTLPLTNSFTPGPKYDGNRTLLSGRRHSAPSETKTVSLAPVHVHNAKKPTPSFDASLERFQTYAHPNRRPTKITGRDYFMLSQRDGNVYRYGSAYR